MEKSDRLKDRLIASGFPRSRDDASPDAEAVSQPSEPSPSSNRTTDSEPPQSKSNSKSDATPVSSAQKASNCLPSGTSGAVSAKSNEQLVSAPLRAMIRWLEHPERSSCWKQHASPDDISALHAELEQSGYSIEPDASSAAVAGVVLLHLKSIPEGLIAGRAKALMIEAGSSVTGVKAALAELSPDLGRMACCTMLFRHWHGCGAPAELVAERVFTSLAKTANAQEFLSLLVGITMCIEQFEQLFANGLATAPVSRQPPPPVARQALPPVTRETQPRATRETPPPRLARAAVPPRAGAHRPSAGAKVAQPGDCEDLLASVHRALGEVELAGERVLHLETEETLTAELEEVAAAKKEKLRLQAENEHVEEREAAERALEAERRREAGRRQADHEFVAESLHRHYGVVIPSGGQPVADMQWVNESLHRHALQQRSPPAPLALLAPDEAEVEGPVKSTEEDTGADEGGGYPEQVQSRLKAWRTELVRELKDLSQPNSPAPCLLYTSDAADEEDSGDLGGRRIIKKKKKERT
eukprot:TRINITY_DN15828_c0_g1_i2.p1 TRINITY_DN15828_c0_g1~~TRINITY_DN15828_c0_g1_i2.p1  ORF type:complete len:528 (+),score=133.55 TRINITY_DN15828_c0_g1_i2:168-1751(+)